MTKQTTMLNARPAASALRRKKKSLPVISTQRNISEAALAVTVAFAAMFLVAAIALALLGVSPVTSLGTPAAVVALAVGGSLSLGSGSSGGMMSMGMDGSASVMPLGVTLAGTVALGLAFYLPLRRWRRLSPGLMAGRIAAAAVTCCLLLVVAADAGRGTLKLPSSLASRLGGGLGGGLGGSSGLGMFGGLGSPGGGSGGGLTSGLSTLTFTTTGAVFPGLAWLLVVLSAGLLVARPATVPAEVTWSRLRTAVGPALSASIRVIAVLLLILGAAGLGVVLVLGGGNGVKLVGAVLLLLPNLLVVVVSAGAGAPWSLSAGPAATSGSGGGLGSIMAGLGGLGGGSGMGGQMQPVHRSIGLFQGPLGIGLLLVAAVILLACGMLADVRVPLRTRRDGTPKESSWQRAKRQAVALGTVWAVGLALVVLCAGLSGTINFSIMGSSMAGFGAQADANALMSGFVGFLAGCVTGGAGSLLMSAIRRRRPGALWFGRAGAILSGAR